MMKVGVVRNLSYSLVLIIVISLIACAEPAATLERQPTALQERTIAETSQRPVTQQPEASPILSPVPAAEAYKNPALSIPERVAALLSLMTLEEKLGQMTQVDRSFLVSEQDITRYFLGSILSGGGSAPTPNTPQAWADMVDRFQRAALATRLEIPIIYGIDAVHGHNNVYGATIFPHNIGLGATRNPALVQEIGRITALEMAGTGIKWTFSPCLCVGRDERWGRSYECFGEDPELVSQMTSLITGYQGSDLSKPYGILATAKHFAGDGGTKGGKDQGNTEASEEDFRRLFVSPYQAAVARNVGSVMVSFSSWNGVKMHANKNMVTGVLKEELGFKGFVVSDWAALKQLPGDYRQQVRLGINAGIDMVMVPDNYKEFLQALRQEVEDGNIPMERIDDAVSRILTQKFALGLFERPFTDRTYTEKIGSPEHRLIARQAVRESLVLLKNEHDILPLSKDTPKIFVAGKNADDIGNQCGGWTQTWQGSSGKITPGTTILEGIQQAVSPGVEVAYHRQAKGLDSTYSVAIVVIGEKPYAEFEGDRPAGLDLDAEDLALVKRVKESGVPTVVILISGRPLIITDQLSGWDALIAAWLPGSEGAGVADVLFGDYRPTGKLPVSWPRSNQQIPINIGDENYDPLFAYGFGLEYP